MYLSGEGLPLQQNSFRRPDCFVPSPGNPDTKTDGLRSYPSIQGCVAEFSRRSDNSAASFEDRARLRTNHNVFNEVETIRKQLKAGLNPAFAQEYPHAQARGLISEFAAGFGNETHYVIRDEHMYAPGNAISTAEALVSHAARGGPREAADAEGFLSIEKSLMQNPEGTVVLQFSPPSVTSAGAFEEGFGAYGFLNIFRRVGNEVLAHHIMYQEDEQLSQSLKLYEKLKEGKKTDAPPKTEDYIANPLVVPPHTGAEGDIMQMLGLWEQWKNHLEERVFFEEHILQDPYISKWLYEYADEQVKAAQMDNFEKSLHAETLLIAAYNRAKHLTSSTQRTPNKNTLLRGAEKNDHHMFAFFASQTLQMKPGSCPISYQAQGTLSAQGFITYSDIAKSFIGYELGKRAEGWTRRDCVTCPMQGCGFVSTKERPHLYNEQEKKWVCANPHCKEHNPDIYKKVMSAV